MNTNLDKCDSYCSNFGCQKKKGCLVYMHRQFDPEVYSDNLDPIMPSLLSIIEIGVITLFVVLTILFI